MLSAGQGVEGERIGVVEPELGVGGDWCTAKARARGEVVPVRVVNTAFRGTVYNLCYLRLAAAQDSGPKKGKGVRACSGASILRMRGMRGMRGMRKWGARNCGPGCEKEFGNAKVTKQRGRNEKNG